METYNIRIILVEPMGGVNVGFIARLMKNFDAKELVLVNPKLNEEDWEIAKIFSSRARDVLDRAIITNTLDDAIGGGDLVVATSAIYKIKGRNLLRRPINIKELIKIIQDRELRNIYIVFGRETTGLKNEEISKCDLMLSLESSEKYPTLNISSSVAIILYELYKNLKAVNKITRIAVNPEVKRWLLYYFNEITAKIVEDERFRQQFQQAFKNIVNRAVPDYREASVLIRVFKKISEKIN